MGSKSHKEKFFTAIIRAGNHASVGDHSRMKKYIKEAKEHHKNHVTEHELNHGRESAIEEHNRFNGYYSNINDIWNGKDVKKSESLTNRGIYYSSKSGDMKISSPGQDKRYSYKHFSELTPDQQVAAKHKFQGTPDIEDHHYPLTSEGTVAHAARWRPESSNSVSNANTPQVEREFASSKPKTGPEVGQGYVKPKLQPSSGEVLPHHKRSSSVRIASEGHSHHGKLGEVQSPNPYYPGKVHVKVSRKGGGFESIFVEPHEAVPSKMQKSEGTDNVIALSKAVLEKIKKRG